MRLHVGCSLDYAFVQPTPMIVILNVHYSRAGDLEAPDHLRTSPGVQLESYRDGFGNWCNRLIAPAGPFTLGTDAVLRDPGTSDPVALDAVQHAIQELPSEVLTYLLGSRYCETDILSEDAWRLFQDAPPGCTRVQAVCDFVHKHIAFNYKNARATRTAAEAFREGTGVCRDYAHLAVAFCRALNIPARYCTGYISDIGQSPPFPDMDFAAWMEVFLGGRWWTFDPRNNTSRIGRVLIARGRDAADVPLTHTFGPNTLTGFRVWTEAT